MPEEEMREAIPGAQEIGANVFVAAQQVALGLFLLGWDVDGGHGAGAI
jgi:hypothetical protein